MLLEDPEAPITTGGTWRRRPVDMNSSEDTSLSMIDLDAALGPFNTPLGRNPEWEAAQRAGGFSKRQLHSAAGMTRFTGPGMHYSHRRAESAPEMPPFNRAGLPRFSSNSTMADVFEEDEEDGEEDDEEMADDDDSSDAATTPGAEEQPAIDIRISEAGNDQAVPSQDAMEDAPSFTLSRRGSGISRMSDDDKTQPSNGPFSDYSASSVHEDVIMEEADDQGLRPEMGSVRDRPDSSDSAAPSPRHVSTCKNLAPVDISPLQLPTTSLAPISPYSTTHSSSFPSPRTPMSFEANRVSTAPSSITEDNFQSLLLLGEPGPDVRNSSDMPSLTSSNSTMTRESAFVQPPQPRPPLAFRGERPASFTSTQFGRRRSSLASLQRLISTSHGERSKLSIEVTIDNEAEKKPKASKTKRISRMMQFWRPKE